MQRSKWMGWLIGGMVLAVLSLNLAPAPAGAAPLFGFTDTPIPSPVTPVTPEPTSPSQPEVFDPVITKRVDVERAQVGDLVQYTLEISNPNSHKDIHKVVIYDTLPEVVDFISTNTPQGTYSYDEGSRTLTYTLGTLTGGQALEITIVCRVNSKATAPDQFDNSATLQWDGGSVTSNTVSVTVIPSTLPKTGEGPGWGELAVMAGAWLAGLAGLGLLGWFGRRLTRPAGRA